MRRVIPYLKRKAPKREFLMRHPLLRPIAHKLDDPNLWHMNRRSVTRGVGVGLFFGVLIPVAHTLVAVAAAIPTRSNAIVAAVSTWAVNPITLPPLIIGAHRLGAWLIAPRTTVDAAAVVVPVGWLAMALHWMAATGAGLLPIAVLASLLGTAITRVGWDLRTRRRWARRNARRMLTHG